MIFLESSYGLANRMRAIASGVGLSTDTIPKQKLNIIWPQNDALNCAFSDLFEPLVQVDMMESFKYGKLLKASAQPDRFKKTIASAFNRLLGIDHCIKADADFKLDVGVEAELVKFIKGKKNIYIKTCAEFGAPENYFSIFKPIAAIQQQIDQRMESFSSHTVGLHIRRSDHIAAKKYSPDEMFFAVIEKELDARDHTKFYLSTDDKETISMLKAKYGDCIINFTKDFSRDSLSGIQNAVIDMYCLANTSKIFGSFNSSFSNVASRIKQIELITLKSSDVPN
jgi:hypothetical protein